MVDPFIVGPTGLPQYRYQDWRGGLVARWRDAYGDDAETSPETPDGLVIDTITLESSQVGDGVQTAYASGFFRTAEGVSLDLVLDLFGRQRLAAQPTTVDAVWWGDALTVVWNGVGTGPGATVVTTGASNGDRYVVTEAGTIPSPDDDGAIVAYLITTGVGGDDYGIEFDAAESVITAGSSDPLDIAEDLAAQIEVDFPTFTATAWADGTRAVILIEGKANESVAVGGSTTVPGNVDIYGGVRLAMAAELTGPRLVLAGTLNTINTPAAGLEGVTNTTDGDPGRNLETDSEFRQRHYDQINVGGRATPARIRAALLDQDPAGRESLDLEDARIFNNPGDEQAVIDGRTVPAHSFEVVLLGDATDEDIAAVIFDQTPAGIQSYGTTTVQVVDAQGDPQPVAFTRATELYLHLSITVTTGEGFPSTGDPETAIKTAVVADLLTRLTLGQDFYREAVRGVVAITIPGVVSSTVTADATPLPGDVPTLVAADIVVAAAEILRADSSRIAVVIS